MCNLPSVSLIPSVILCSLLLACAAPASDAAAGAPAAVLQNAGTWTDPSVILSEPADPYYPLAEEMARREGLPIVHSLEEALAQDPVFLLWVVSPRRLSDQALIDFGLGMRHRPSLISVGIISGTTLEDARDLWLRASEVRGERVTAANAANPAGHIAAQILAFSQAETVFLPLTQANLVRSLRNADYLTFTGHGGKGFLRLDQDTTLRRDDIPPLDPVVVATGSCSTFRLWEENSIALAFTDQGAAAYAGFAYSPNEGYLIGEFEGVPFRYTWPGFPIGHIVQVQNHGTLQGFAQFPFYYLLGDPRIALQAEAPYQLVGSQQTGDTLTLNFAAAPAGMIPVHVPGGASYDFAKIPGVGAAWDRAPFYNARLQMVNIGGDKYLLFAHRGGDFTLHLRPHPPWYWVMGDVLIDALDHTLLYLQDGAGAFLFLIGGVLALLPAVWLLLRQRAPVRTLVPAALTGLGFAILHGLYALFRLERLTITSKVVEFSPLSLVGTFLLVGCGAFFFLNARSWRGRVVATAVAALGALAPAVLTLGILALTNTLYSASEVGLGLWNYALGLQALLASAFEAALFGIVFIALSKTMRSPGRQSERPPDEAFARERGATFEALRE